MFQIGEKKSKLISDLCMAEGEIAGRENIFLVGHSAPAEYVMCTYGVSTCTGSPYRECVHIGHMFIILEVLFSLAFSSSF